MHYFILRGFIHRCGRTARMGRSGHALVFLLPSETAYVQYMDISQHVVLLPLTLDEEEREKDNDKWINKVKDALCKERYCTYSSTYIHIHVYT